MTETPLPPPSLPARDGLGHKGSFGTAAVVGGCSDGDSRMVGAPALAAIGALRAGAGLARLVMPEPVLSAGLSIAPSATGLALAVDAHGGVIPHDATRLLDQIVASCEALAVGPGLGAGPAVQAIALRSLQQETTPVVVDADAINALAQIPELSQDFRARAVITPHPGEFRRLAAPLRITLDPTDPASRPGAAETMAQRLGCVVVLKGAGTVVSDGHRTWVCEHGHPCLATAGTGDVLTGVIAGLIAQFVRLPAPEIAALPHAARDALRHDGAGALDLFDAARAGVLAHAIAGERWALTAGASAGLLATELAALIPGAVETLRPR